MRLKILFALAVIPAVAGAQNVSTDPVVQRIWLEGTQNSQAARLAQVLIDSIGPRVSGSPGFLSAVDWLTGVYQGAGVPVRRENYGTWRGWQQGTVHMELTSPRSQNLSVEMLAFSPGTTGPVEGDVLLLPQPSDSAAVRRWLASARGKFVLASPPEIMCRAQQELERFARPSTIAGITAQRQQSQREYASRALNLGGTNREIHRRLEEAGVAAIVTSLWSNGWGVNKIHGASAERVPTVDLSCEDYGLLWRLASNNQGPRVRLSAEITQGTAEVPMYNVIAELRGTELPDEYVVLGAHLDSWSAATGATDNGTGTIMMLEAMRMLKAAYPRPRRTILVAHFGAEEQGLYGSGAFTADHPEIVRGLQAAFIHDNGTWRVDYIQAQGFRNAGPSLAGWLARVPRELTDSIRLDAPGPQEAGSDHHAFICHGAPGFRLQSNYGEYRQYTWHTNLDTYDKIVFDDLRQNAMLAAIMAYAASEDPSRTPREQVATLPPAANGRPRTWPVCAALRRSFRP